MTEQRPPNLKVGRLIRDYGLGEDFGDYLERRWTGESGERLSLRDLADLFNRRLLEAAMRENGMSPLAGEVENIYELLTDEDVSSADRTRSRRRLEREGVDVSQVTDDFVSYQAIRTYLKDRGAEYSGRDDRAAAAASTIQQLRSRTATITESKLEQLREGDELDLGQFRVMVDVRVVCEDCGAQYDVTELLDRGGCDCR
jgi:hypothetical protein